MCYYYYLHHHHLPPCTRDIEFVVHYAFCPGEATATQIPCSDLHYDPGQQYESAAHIDYADPCASGGCLASPDCASGGCRLAQLQGNWVCCQCGRGGNEYRWCSHPLKHSPDTLCYHVCCSECRFDDGEQHLGHDAHARARRVGERRGAAKTMVDGQGTRTSASGHGASRVAKVGKR